MAAGEHALVCASVRPRKRPSQTPNPQPPKLRKTVGPKPIDMGTGPKARREQREEIRAKCAGLLTRSEEFSSLEVKLRAVQSSLPVKESAAKECSAPHELRKMPKRATSKQRQSLREARARFRRAALKEECQILNTTDLGSAEFYASAKRCQARFRDTLGRVPNCRQRGPKPRELAEWFGSYFSFTSERETIGFPSLPCASRQYLGLRPREPEVRRACAKLKCNRSPGPDGILPDIVAYGGELLHSCLTSLLRSL